MLSHKVRLFALATSHVADPTKAFTQETRWAVETSEIIIVVQAMTGNFPTSLVYLM